MRRREKRGAGYGQQSFIIMKSLDKPGRQQERKAKQRGSDKRELHLGRVMASDRDQGDGDGDQRQNLMNPFGLSQDAGQGKGRAEDRQRQAVDEAECGQPDSRGIERWCVAVHDGALRSGIRPAPVRERIGHFRDRIGRILNLFRNESRIET